MMRQNNGFQALLKADVPHVFVLGCVCHSMALSTSCVCHHGSKQLSKDICFYFSHSNKRNHTLNLIQDVVANKKHKILKLCQTRWLSRGQVVDRIIEQWDALELYFQCESQTDKVDNAGHIYKTMHTAGTKHMLLFVAYVLQKVNAMNLEFQSQQLRLHKLFAAICVEYRSLLGMYIHHNVATSRALSDSQTLTHWIHPVVKGGMRQN